MQTNTDRRGDRHWAKVWMAFILTVLLPLLLSRCSPSGDSVDVTHPSAPSPQVEQQAIENLVALYQQAVLQEDIDRFETLLQPTGTAQANQRQSSDPITSLSTLRDTLRSTFQQHTLLWSSENGHKIKPPERFFRIHWD